MYWKPVWVLLSLLLTACEPTVDAARLPVVPPVDTESFMPAARDQIETLRGRVDRAPLDAEAAAELGIACLAYRQHPAAAAALARAVMIRSERFDWHFFHAEALVRLGHADEAVSAYREALARAPEQSAVRTRLAVLQMQRGDLKEAGAQLTRVLEDDPGYAPARLQLARLRIRAGQPADAIAGLEDLLETVGPSEDIYFALAEAHRLSGGTERAAANLELFERHRGRALASGDPLLERLRGVDATGRRQLNEAQRLLQAGRLDEAASVLDEVLTLDPASLTAHAGLISLYGMQGQSDLAEAQFERALAAAGLEFTHRPGARGRFHFPEIMGAGVGLIDYDGDGDLDVYTIQGGPIGEDPAATESGRSGNRLYRNDLDDAGRLRFSDVTGQAGVGDRGYGMGVATGDVDNDGDTDLYVTNFGPNVLYRNDGDGTFTDVTAEAGVDDPRWSTSAAFLDYDRDGDLDLFVTQYVSYAVTDNLRCTSPAGQRDYCDPNAFSPLSDTLWRNEGGGRFTDVTAEAGIGVAFGNGLGVTVSDFDLDGWPDLYVANDQGPNQLWINLGDGRFEDRALISGCAYNADGAPEASMGVTAADYDDDGDDDLFLTHLRGETNTLYRNEGDAGFMDVTDLSGLSVPSLTYTGFGTAFGDVDNDGDVDIVVSNNAGRLRLYLNEIGDEGGWLRVRLTGTDSVRDGTGAVATLELADGRTLQRRAHTDGSYLSAGDPRVHFGLGGSEPIALTVAWPSGRVERWDVAGRGVGLALVEGTGVSVEGG